MQKKKIRNCYVLLQIVVCSVLKGPSGDFPRICSPFTRQSFYFRGSTVKIFDLPPTNADFEVKVDCDQLFILYRRFLYKWTTCFPQTSLANKSLAKNFWAQSSLQANMRPTFLPSILNPWNWSQIFKCKKFTQLMAWSLKKVVDSRRFTWVRILCSLICRSCCFPLRTTAYT